jgi:peptidyl-prolyl cis-trans isomerase SurA
MKIFLSILFLYLTISNAKSIETKIVHKIQNEIITSIDIKKEFSYLVALNNILKKLEKEKILTISNESLIREKVKKIEILKNFKEIEINNEYLIFLLKNVYLKLNLKSLKEFELYLKDFDLTIEEVKRKITIDALWNEVIIKKYASQVTINKEQIKKNLSQNKNIQSKEYRLSEIIFEVENKEEIKESYKEIIKSIAEIGFENSASIYSFSESAKIGGDIGWINENSLNNKIKKKIYNLKIGEISKPIILSNGILMLKIINIKYSDNDIDLETKFKNAINYERNRQLRQYSKIYYNKIKKNLEFDE